jgi:phenylalanyl-tRNA synthetase beta chain
MKLSPQWIRDFVDLSVDDQKLAGDLTAIGIAVEGISGSGADTIFEMEIGTNRPDAMNHYGVAREAAAMYDLPLRALSALDSQPSDNSLDHSAFPIVIEETALCPRFTARVIRGTSIKPSPENIARRLQLLDQRPISNAVDATNYVLWEMGKPTHVYDLDLLAGGKILVRMARAGEKLKTLDGVVRTLTADDLVVADAEKAVGLAGVMGGYDTMITEKTKNILIESAWWDPITVRKMGRRHGLHTDASHRFERGADFESTMLSCDLVAQMILQSGGGELVGDAMDVVSKELDQAPIVLRIAEVWRILGSKITEREILRILKKLGFDSVPAGSHGGEFDLHIPSWRLDVSREIDLIEEIARLHGYDKFENTLPAYSGAVIDLPHAAADATLRKRALALGYDEAVSLTFISHADAERFESGTSSASAAKAGPRFESETAALETLRQPKANSSERASKETLARVLELENPLSEEASVMRTSLAPGMLDMLGWNLNRDAASVRLFEMGRVYAKSDGERVEPRWACLGATLQAVKESMPAGGVLDVSKGDHAVAAEAFRTFKGDVENLLAAFSCGELTFDRETADYFHAGRSARALMDGTPVAQFGQINGAEAAARKLRQDVFLAEIDLEKLYERGLRTVRYAPLAKYPVVERDFSFIFSDAVSFESMKRAVAGVQVSKLREFLPVEIFRGGAIGSGKYSILLRATFQSNERTLREEEVAQWSGKIVGALQELGGVQRA